MKITVGALRSLIESALSEKQKNPCWKGYEMIGQKKKNGKTVPNCVPENDELDEAEYQGRNVKLNKPTRSEKSDKSKKVYVKNDKGNVVAVHFGDPKMKNKSHNPARRKSFRARHNCKNPGPKWKARYWSCKEW